jgi:hypothetical protein
MMMAVLENNDDYVWQDQLDAQLGLTALAHDHRVATSVQRSKDMLRKRGDKYGLRRTMRQKFVYERQGKQVLGWKKPRPAEAYKSDSQRAPKTPKPRKTAAAAAQPPKPAVCARCKLSHATRQCPLPRLAAPHGSEKESMDELLREVKRAEQALCAKQTTKRARNEGAQ